MTAGHKRDQAMVKRWHKGNEFERSTLLAQIQDGALDGGAVLSDLSRAEQQIALTAIAEAEYAVALGHLAAAAAAWAYLLERFAAGEGIDSDFLQQAGNGFVLAAASGQEPAVKRMLSAFSSARTKFVRPSADILLSDVFAALCRRDLESASQALVPAILNSERSDTVAMLQAIIDHDESAFRKSVADSAARWRKAIRAERLQKFPDAVCDHWAIGDIRLAERVWGRRPDVDLAVGQIPAEIFDVVPVPVDGTL